MKKISVALNGKEGGDTEDNLLCNASKFKRFIVTLYHL